MERDFLQPRQYSVQMSKDSAILFIRMIHLRTSESTEPRAASAGLSDRFQSINWPKEQQHVSQDSHNNGAHE